MLRRDQSDRSVRRDLSSRPYLDGREPAARGARPRMAGRRRPKTVWIFVQGGFDVNAYQTAFKN